MKRPLIKLLKILTVVCLFSLRVFYLQAGNQKAPSDVSELLQQMNAVIQTDIHLADSLAQKALLAATALGNDSLIAYSNFGLGFVHYFKGNYYCSSYYYEKALKTEYAKRAPQFAESCWNNLGVNYKLMSRYAESTEAYYNSLKLAEQQGDSLGIYQAYINIGHLHDLLGQSATGSKYLDEALRYFTDTDDAYHTALSYQNIGISRRLKGEMDASIYYLRKAVDVFYELEAWHDLLKSYYDLGAVLLMQGKAYEAKPALDSVIQLSIDLNDGFWYASGLMLMADYYLHLNDYVLAEKYLEQAMEALLPHENSNALRNLYTLQILLYAKTGHDEKLRESISRFDSISQSLILKSTDANIAQFRSMYELDQHLHKLDMLNTELTLNRKILRNRSIFALLTFVLSVVSVTLYFNLRKKKQALFSRNLDLITERKHHNSFLVGASVVKETTYDNNGNGTQTDNHKFMKLYQRIRAHIIENKSYMNPNLNIADLAFALHTNEKYISRAIAEVSGSNFSTFINTFRVNEAKKLLSDPAYNMLTSDQVADKCGFSNSHTCRRNFRKITGLNPLDFRSMAQREVD